MKRKPLILLAVVLAVLGAAAIFGLHLPKIRDEARRLIVAQQFVVGEPAGGITTRVEG